VRKEERKYVMVRLRTEETKENRGQRLNHLIGQKLRAVNFSHPFLIALVLAVSFISVNCRLGHAADPKIEQRKPEPQTAQVAQKSPQTPIKFNVADFVYSSDGRRDPFQSLPLTRLRDNNRMKKTVKKGYELEELKIVGLLKTDKSKYVMMEDVQGKGITFQKGDYLNSNLWVADVLDGNVVFGYKLKEEIKKFTVDVPRK
jgi:Tfp pilus assembly protein PilP